MREALTCSHCGLAYEGSRATPAGQRYCCLGCRLAAQIAGGVDGPRGFLTARLLLSAFLAMGVMTFSLVLYGEAIYGTEAAPDATAFRLFFRLLLAAFSLPVFLLIGIPIALGAFRDLRQGLIRMDGLILIATLAAYGLSIHNTVVGTGEVYYETATMVLVVVTFGRRLEAHARSRGRSAAETLGDCLPRRAHLVLGQGAAERRPEELHPGDRVRVLPGETVPADVRVIEGTSDVSVAHITGEQDPVPVGVGREVPAGAINGTGLFDAEVLRVWSDGGLGRLRVLLDSPLPLTRTTRLVDRLAGRLAGLAIALAVIGGWRAAVAGGLGDGIGVSLAVLLVACPCALGLATPLAYRAVRAGLARRGLLVQDPVALEAGASINHVLLDKTGTLTELSGSRIAYGDTRSLAAMSALVASSGHALAGRATGVEAPRDLRLRPGEGVEARLGDRQVRAGSPAWMDREGYAWDEDLIVRRHELERRDATLVAFADGGRVRALSAVEQHLRPGAEEAVRALQRLDVVVEVLSGDRPRAVEAVALRLGIEGHGDLRPDQKVARIAELRASSRRVMMVGDGVNDAPALRAADVGIAIATGTSAARAQAQVEVIGEDLRVLPGFVEGARRLRGVVRGNIAWTLTYNAVALALAFLGQLHPLVAVSAMVVSSVIVSVRSLRLLDLGPETGP